MTIATVYLFSLSLRLDIVQQRLARIVTSEIEEILEIPVSAGALGISNIDELILKDIVLRDNSGDTVLTAEKIVAHISPAQLLKNRIQINTLAIAAPDIRLHRDSAAAPVNIQFILDKFKKNDNSEKLPFSLHINQLLVYDGKFRYDILDTPTVEERFDPNHIALDGIRLNVSLKKLLRDDMDLLVRTISGKERSGLNLKRLKTNIKAREGYIKLEEMDIEFQSSRITSDSVAVSFKKDTPKALEFSGNIASEKITPADFTSLFGKVCEKVPAFAFNVSSRSDSAQSRTALSARTTDDNISLKAIATIEQPYEKEQAKVNIYLRHLNIDKEGVSLLQSFLTDDIPALADKTGDCTLTGEAELTQHGIDGNAIIETANGNVALYTAIENKGKYKIAINGDGLNIGKLAGLSTPLACSLQTEINGCINETEKRANFIGKVTDLDNGKHIFEPISFNGTYDIADSHLNASLSSNDPGVTASMHVDYSKKKEHRITMSLDADTINPYIIGLNEKEEEFFSFNFDGEFNYKDEKNSILNAKLQNFTFHESNRKSMVKNIHFCDNRTEEQRLAMINSDFINFSVIGEYDYRSILSNLHYLTAKHVPSLAKGVKMLPSGDCNYIFKCDIKESHFISNLLELPFVINENSQISGSCNNKKETLAIDTEINGIEIGKGKFRTIGFSGKSNKDSLTFSSRIIKQNKPSADGRNSNDLRIYMACTLSNDTIKNKIHWGNSRNRKRTNGTLRLEAMLDRDKDDMLYINANVFPDSITHNDSIWHISGGNVSGNTDKINIRNLYLYNAHQHLHLDGAIGKSITDTLNVRLHNLEVQTILDLVRFRTLKFNGNATGSAYATGILSAPEARGRFNVDSLKIDDGYLGKGDLSIGWDNPSKSILLGCDVHSDNGKVSKVNGFLSEVNDTIHIDIDADEINAIFMNKMLQSFLTDIDGTASGKAHLHGKWRGIDLTGAVALNCSARIIPTNVRYSFHGDTLHMTRGLLTFNEALVTDKRGNKGWLSGKVKHKKLGYWECDLDARAENLLVYDTHNFDENPFYGTIYATGNANLKANDKGLFLKAEVSNNPNSRLVYNASESGSIRDNSFVTFIDSSKKPTESNQTNENTNITYKNVESSLNLDFLIDINEGMQVKVYTNLKSDDYIDLYGHGTVNAVFDEKDGFSLKGNMDLDRGAYKITVQDIFTKEFNITKGSSLLFNGDPYLATLDLKTKYVVPSASLNALTTEATKRKSVKVNCLLNITGTLESPILNFDLELPDGNEEEKEMLASATSTPEQKNMQFIYLLGIGKFYTYDYNNPLATNTQSSTAVESLISNTLSGQLNNMLGQIIDNGNWNISGNISTSERGWNSMEVEGMLEGRLLNDRLLINGNLGYRENPIANRNFIGDFELQWLLNSKGTVSLKAYSKTNDRYFSKTNLTTQGAGLILRHDFNRWIWWKKKKEKSKDKDKKKDE